MELWPGKPYPLGAQADEGGTNFALFSDSAEAVYLCLFDGGGNEERIRLTEVDAYVWHGYLPNVFPGQHYGFRVDGPWDPGNGKRFNVNKLLLDPYARAIAGGLAWGQPLYSYTFGEPLTRNDDDSAAHTYRSVVVDAGFDWGGGDGREVARPDTPYHRTVIYEAHVKGLTQQHPEVPEHQRGRYAGVAHPAVVSHLKNLGVTAVELMPVHQFVQDDALEERGLRNYWGYNTIGFFAPHNEYASATDPCEQVREFKEMVKELHRNGLEVILDVVYNHTGEGSDLGPTLSFRGIDNDGYYRLVDGDLAHYLDYTGTGNSFNVRQPHPLALIMDSLRYWVTEMHVDGFRFDLAATLAREFYEVDKLSAFFEMVQQDPVISRVKLIAEPWDLGPGGYQVGNFPPQWTEWNGKFRDTVRDFWRGEPATLGEFASRLTGSSDLYGHSGRRPAASINFVTAHDGFTLADLVSYNDKHNEANGEGNRDGESINRSWNCGVEGPTDDAAVNTLRARQQRNFLTTLLLSQGVPMISHGDELGRTQHGNNNGYAQDSALTWINWEAADTELVDFAARLGALRASHPVFRRRRFFDGRPTDRGDDGALPDIVWLRPDAAAMTAGDWDSGFGRSIGVFLNGAGLPECDEHGQPVVDDCFLMLFNAGDDAVDFTLPDRGYADSWVVEIHTGGAGAGEFAAGQVVGVAGRSTLVLRAPGRD
ncbi:glycogen debranching protein GlgX [Arthrobacter wenxiniae]|uniref:Glycogen debranching protein GlgX n=1 Tax=Arthrobacter wenxiniae TaxID=2713570 RepID=A0A7Y7IJA2_9MICC|nr:glycogen debranching protein GlgX [Arthrobacter wenxiniae]